MTEKRRHKPTPPPLNKWSGKTERDTPPQGCLPRLIVTLMGLTR